MILFLAWKGPISTANNSIYEGALFKTLKEDNALIFTARAISDAHLGYFSERKDYGVMYGNRDPLYEIVIGGWANGRSVIRREGSEKRGISTPDILNPNEDRLFWADAKDGLIRLGRGNTTGNEIILQWQDNQPLDLTYVGFMTCCGYSGIWNYID